MGSMKLKQKFELAHICKFSHCGEFLAVHDRNSLLVLNACDLTEVKRILPIHSATDIDWCLDSNHILYFNSETKHISAFSIETDEWTCNIHIGKEGVVKATWSPSGRHIISISDFYIRITVWSLDGGPLIYLQNCKISPSSTIKFSNDGKFYGLISNDGTSTNLFCTSTWENISNIDHESKIYTSLTWNPNNDRFAEFDELEIKKCYVAIYSASTSEKIGHFKRKRANEVLGVRGIEWTPNGQLLAVACYDNSIYIIEELLFTAVAILSHSKSISDLTLKLYELDGNLIKEPQERPVTFTTVDQTLLDMPGVNKFIFDKSSNILASVLESMPALLWVWDLSEVKIRCILVFPSPVVELTLGGTFYLLINCNTSYLYTLHKGTPSIKFLQDLYSDGESIVSVSCQSSKPTTSILIKGQSGAYLYTRTK